MARRPSYQNYYQSFMTENMNPLYKRYLEYLMEDLPDVSDIGGYFDVPTTEEREGIESLDTEIKTPMAPMNQTRGGDGDQRGIGRFQNLDPRSEKMVLINGVPTKVYRNITSGLLQTFDGKNVKGDVTETGAFDYEGDAYGTKKGDVGFFDPSNPAGISVFAPSTSPFSLSERNRVAQENQKIYEEKLEQQRIEQQKAEAARIAAEKEKQRLQQLGQYKDRGGFDPSGPTQQSIRNEREDKSGKGQSGGFTNPGKGSYGPHS
jgi:hypothetical protein